MQNTSGTTPNKIELLPEHLIDQIKAGEVVEKASSLLKELMENSIDAGSSEISISIQNNGLDLLSIKDNGHGISFNDLPLAFSRHATSKITDYSDLFKLSSYGFRGEALASIASIARVTCQSQTSRESSKIVIDGGLVKSHSKHRFEEDNSGTAIFISDLFYNTPVRLNFIKSKNSEKNSLKKVIESFVLAHPEIQFKITWDDKPTQIFEPVSIITKEENIFIPRFERIAGIKKNKDTHESTTIVSQLEYEGHQVTCLLGTNIKKSHFGRHQFLMANNRLFFDKSLHQNIIRTLSSYHPNFNQGEQGDYLVLITVPKSLVDINVHPNKTEIKFQKYNLIRSLISENIKKAVEKIEFNSGANSLLPINSPDILPASHTENNSSSNFSLTSQNNRDQHLPFKQDNFGNGVNDSIINITSHYSGISIEGHFYIFNISQLIKDFFLTSVKDLTPLKENELVPLLICEPINIDKNLSNQQIKSLQERFNEFGILNDLLESHLLLLKTLPHHFMKIGQTNLINLLYSFISSPEVFTPSANNITSSDLTAMIQYLESQNNLSSFTILNNELITSLISND